MRKLVASLVLIAAVALPLTAVPAGKPKAPKLKAQIAASWVRSAIKREKQALTDTNRKDFEKDVELSVFDLLSAAHAVDPYDSGRAGPEIEAAIRSDNRSENSGKRAAGYVHEAMLHKRKALVALEAFTGEDEGYRCEAEKEFTLYAVPAGYTASYADVYPHGIPRNAKNIRLEFVDARTHRPIKEDEEAFEGQTWKASIKGFKTRGGKTVLHVHVDVTGKGVGKPDEISDEWAVRVSWDC
jgi:hypothetical protein